MSLPHYHVTDKSKFLPPLVSNPDNDMRIRETPTREDGKNVKIDCEVRGLTVLGVDLWEGEAKKKNKKVKIKGYKYSTSVDNKAESVS
jgi:hypothetical protein